MSSLNDPLNMPTGDPSESYLKVEQRREGLLKMSWRESVLYISKLCHLICCRGNELCGL